MYDTWPHAAPESPFRLLRTGCAPERGPGSALEGALFAALRSVLLAVWADPGWMGAHFRADIVPLLRMPAGPELMASLAALPSGPDGRCPAPHDDVGPPVPDLPPLGSPGNPCVCLLAVAAGWQSCQGYAAARARGATVAAAGAAPLVLPRDGNRPALGDPACEELAGALRLSPGAMASRLDQSRRLAAAPELADLVEEGILPETSAVRIAAGLDGLDDQDSSWCRARFAERVRGRLDRGLRPWTGTDASACARRLALQCPSSRVSRRRAVADRHVRRWSNGDGTSTLSAVLPELTAERMYRRLTAMAVGLGEDDGRPMDARRADLLADLVLGETASQASGVEVQVVIDAATLAGSAERPAEVPGFGPVPGDVARELAADAPWRAWIRDAAGSVVATGSRRYTPGAALARLVRARDPMCRAPGCRRSASRCDLDHAVPWPNGPTTPANLGPLCRRHHIMKTHLGWRIDVSDEREILWTTPAGTRIVQEREGPVPQ